jgi:hypothetical protein
MNAKAVLDNERRTALHLHSFAGSGAILDDHGLTKAVVTKTENGETPLYLALQHRVGKRSLEILQLLIERYPGEATKSGWIPLHFTCSQLPYR